MEIKVGVGRFIRIVASPLLSPMVHCRMYHHVVNYFGLKELLSIMSNPDFAVIFSGVRSINYFDIFELSYPQEDLVSGIICRG